MKLNVLIIDGSVGGKAGNTFAAAQKLFSRLSDQVELSFLHLNETHALGTVIPQIKKADGFVFMTGTYWDSWGSPLQKFLEDTTYLESSDLWIGKPASVFVTMHSVGGREVLSRLQGVLSSLGLQIPPMSGMVYSAVANVALNVDEEGEVQRDLWRLNDLEILADNLILSLKACGQNAILWRRWDVDRDDAKRNWMQSKIRR